MGLPDIAFKITRENLAFNASDEKSVFGQHYFTNNAKDMRER